MIQIMNYLGPDRVFVSHEQTRDALLDEMLSRMENAPGIGDSDALRRGIFARESIMTTGIGQGLAVPHVRLASVTEMVLAVAKNETSVDFNSLDDEPVRLVFMVAGPAESHRQYLRVLAKIALIARSDAHRQAFFSASTDAELWTFLTQFD